MLKTDEAVRIICSVLEIDAPKIVHKNKGVVTQTTMACYNPADDVLTINDSIPEFDKLHSIAHELRHKWQIKYRGSEFFSDYFPISEAVDRNKYNQQFAEIDAQAFAAVIMESALCVRPLFRGLDNKTKLMIKRRKEEIEDETIEAINKVLEEEQ